MRRVLIATAVTVVALASLAALSGTLFFPSFNKSTSAASSSLTGSQYQSLGIAMNDGTGASRNGITVMGEGVIAVKPDMARVTLGVEVSNQSASAAQQDAAAKMDSVMAELKNLGIEEKDIQTVRFQLSPEYDHSGNTPVLKGYRVTNLVAVTIRDVTQVGGLLDTVVASGATRLHGINFSVSDPAAAGAQGRQQAMESAKGKAEQLANLAGVTLGPVVAIEESVSAPEAPMEMAVARDMAMAAPATPISPGMQEVRTIVRVTYSIN
ncbi:MAG: SIMPL domain-containing protein [Chloroflexota bacterium]|jgi:uncharacterized protein YggE